MKAVIPSDSQNEDGEIYPFFGQARYFFVYEIINLKVNKVEIIENQDADYIQGLSHDDKPFAVKKMIEKYLDSIDVFVAVNMNPGIVASLESRGKRVIFMEGGEIKKIALDSLVNK